MHSSGRRDNRHNNRENNQSSSSNRNNRNNQDRSHNQEQTLSSRASRILTEDILRRVTRLEEENHLLWGRTETRATVIFEDGTLATQRLPPVIEELQTRIERIETNLREQRLPPGLSGTVGQRLEDLEERANLLSGDVSRLVNQVPTLIRQVEVLDRAVAETNRRIEQGLEELRQGQIRAVEQARYSTQHQNQRIEVIERDLHRIAQTCEELIEHFLQELTQEEGERGRVREVLSHIARDTEETVRAQEDFFTVIGQLRTILQGQIPQQDQPIRPGTPRPGTPSTAEELLRPELLPTLTAQELHRVATSQEQLPPIYSPPRIRVVVSENVGSHATGPRRAEGSSESSSGSTF